MQMVKRLPAGTSRQEYCTHTYTHTQTHRHTVKKPRQCSWPFQAAFVVSESTKQFAGNEQPVLITSHVSAPLYITSHHYITRISASHTQCPVSSMRVGEDVQPDH
eukprot:908715-Pelagomonas_calceolata.AAC.2